MLTTKEGKDDYEKERAQRINVVISDKSLTVRVGSERVTEMIYSHDSTQTPATIDATCEGNSLLGIYKVDGDKLLVRFNAVEDGRPKDFDDKTVAMAMDLNRIHDSVLLFFDEDGKGIECHKPVPDYSGCGSPRWARDGKKIVFDAWRSWCGEEAQYSHVFIVNPDGSLLKDLGPGALPSVSMDGKRITFSRYSPDRGIWAMNTDGSEPKLIDPEGWCSDWVSDEEVVYTVHLEDGANLRAHNLKTGKTRLLLPAGKYQHIYWGLATSRDGKWICFRGITIDGEDQLAIARTEGAKKGFKVLLPCDALSEMTYFDHYVNWTPDDKHVTALIRTRERPNLQLYNLDIEGKEAPRWVTRQAPGYQFYCSSWSPDGRRLVTVGWAFKPAAKEKDAEEVEDTDSEEIEQK